MSTTEDDAKCCNEIIEAKNYHFETINKIGCTQLLHGTVRDCHNRVKNVAGKIIKADKLSEFLRSEGSVYRILNSHPHPGLPKLVNSLEAPNGTGVIVIRSLGDDLHSYVRDEKKLSEDIAKKLFFQLVLAVNHCHSHRIVLRDMKLGKIFFIDEAKTEIIIGDLDGAQEIPHNNPLLCDQKGSPAYVSPEVLACQPYNGFAADVWALGVILFVMLTGTYPFQDSRPANLFQKIQQASAAVKFPPFISDGARELIRKLLSRDPQMRPTTQHLLSEAWLRPEALPKRQMLDEALSVQRGSVGEKRDCKSPSCENEPGDQLVPDCDVDDEVFCKVAPLPAYVQRNLRRRSSSHDLLLSQEPERPQALELRKRKSESSDIEIVVATGCEKYERGEKPPKRLSVSDDIVLRTASVCS
jgi:serine/threonine protein kinase